MLYTPANCSSSVVFIHHNGNHIITYRKTHRDTDGVKEESHRKRCKKKKEQVKVICASKLCLCSCFLLRVFGLGAWLCPPCFPRTCLFFVSHSHPRWEQSSHFLFPILIATLACLYQWCSFVWESNSRSNLFVYSFDVYRQNSIWFVHILEYLDLPFLLQDSFAIFAYQ